MGLVVGRSMGAAVYQLVWRTEQAFESEEYARRIFLDIEGALDNIKAIEVAIEEGRIDQCIHKWNFHMLRIRQIIIDLKGIKSSKIVQRDVHIGGGGDKFSIQ